MNAEQWLEKNAEKTPSLIAPDDAQREQWVTKSRGDYLTLVGMESNLDFIFDRGIVEHLSSSSRAGCTVNIGFNPDEQKWYGWSHRAIYGFGVGSECKRGDSHYRPVDKDDFLQCVIDFWSDEHHLNMTGEHRETGVYLEWVVSDLAPNEKMRGTTHGAVRDYPEEYGRGEWVAKTLADARQMAIDFARSVS